MKCLGGESQWTTQPGGDITRYDAITAAYAAHALVTDAIHEGRIGYKRLAFVNILETFSNKSNYKNKLAEEE